MPRPSKGLRKQIGIRPHQLSRHAACVLTKRAMEQGTSVGQYVADLLAFAVGRPDCALEMTQQTLFSPGDLDTAGITPQLNFAPRCHIEVYDLIQEATSANQMPKALYALQVCEAHAANKPLPKLPPVVLPDEENLLLSSA